MAQPTAPNPPQRDELFVDKNGLLTARGHMHLNQMWRQLAAGFVIVPCSIAGTNDLVLTPLLDEEGAASYGNGMTWWGAAVETSTGVMTAQVGSLTALKLYVANGATQANIGDVVDNSTYFFSFASHLDSGAGGLVLK